MKNASLILNAVLVVAVVVLFVLHFSQKPLGGVSGGAFTPSDVKVAYVNYDTLLKYYEFVKVNRDRLGKQAQAMSDQLANRQSALQRDIQAYQNGAGNLTISQARDLEQSLQQKGQNLQMYEQSLQQQMMDDQSKVAEQLYTKLTEYLKTYSKERGLAVVVKYDRSSDILYAGDSLDISKNVIKGLNDAWKTESQKPAAADTTKVK